MDSTGVSVFTRKTEGDPFHSTTLKALGPAPNLMDSKAFDKAFQQTNKKILLGHTRQATRGDIRTSNAHPFEFSRFVGAHNGTLDYSTHRDLPNHKYFDTDSEALISSINEVGVKTTIETQEGAWALSLVDKHSGTLHFIRNDQRDLCFCFNEDHDVLYWASEARFLRFCLDRRGIKIHEDKVFRFAENVLYTYDIPLRMNAKILEPERESVKGKEHVPFLKRYDAWQPAKTAAERMFMGAPTDKSKEKPKDGTAVVQLMTKHNIPKATDSDIHTSISHLPKFHADFYETRGKKQNRVRLFHQYNKQHPWSERVFAKYTAQGCAFCTEVPTWGDNVVFCRADAFVCQKCSGDEGVEEAIRSNDPQLPVMGAREFNDALPIIN